MPEQIINRRSTVNKTSLYDPIIGFLYSSDLFEKDLYREKIFENRREISTTSAFQARNPQAGQANP